MNITDLSSPEQMVLGGIQIINVPDFLEFLLRFVLDTSVILILVRYLYYPVTKRKDYLLKRCFLVKHRYFTP